jgi:hypothetical protein
MTTKGTQSHDAGDYDGALREYRAAIALWPQNGFAHYEVGYTLREQEMVKAGKKKLVPDTLIINGDIKNSPEVEEAFAKARKHDPFQLKAYQGTDKDLIRGFMALAKTGLPAWQKLASEPSKQHPDRVIEELAAACQEAGIHDLALAARQIIVARRGEFAPVDHPFITRNLRKLAPGKSTDAALKRLAGPGKVRFRQLIVPDKAE